MRDVFQTCVQGSCIGGRKLVAALLSRQICKGIQSVHSSIECGHVFGSNDDHLANLQEACSDATAQPATDGDKAHSLVAKLRNTDWYPMHV